MDSIEVEFQKLQYQTIRQELLDSNKNAHEAVRWGHGALAVMISVGLAAQTLDGIDLARTVYFGVVVPVFALVTFFLWFGEVVRQQRAYTFLEELERELNPLINGGRSALTWHHQWLRTETQNPLQGLQFGHYRNMAMGFWFWVPVSGTLSIWACSLATDSFSVRVAWSLFITLQMAGVIALYNALAKRMFRYDLIAWILSVPWVSYLCLVFRLAVFLIIGAHITNAISIQPATVILLCIAYVAIDLADGYLVRRFCPSHAATFEFLDRALDMTGVTSLVLLLGVDGRLSPIIIWIVVVREGGFALIALVLTSIKRQPFSVSGMIGRLFHLFMAIVIVSAALNLTIPDGATAALCGAMAAVSVITYIRDPRFRQILRKG